MTVTPDIIDRARRVLLDAATGMISRVGESLTIGMIGTEGREIPVMVRSTVHPDTVVCSDAGESWWKLVTGGFSDPVPTDSDRRKIDRLAAEFGVRWDARSGELRALCTLQHVADAARRVSSASVALDAWRVWYPPLKRPPSYADAPFVARRLEQVGGKSGWDVSLNARMEGHSGHAWRIVASLARANRRAAVTVTRESASRVVERIIGFHADVGAPLIALVPPDVADDLKNASELRDRGVALERTKQQLAARVLRAATEIGALAA